MSTTTGKWLISGVAFVVVTDFISRPAAIGLSVILILGALFADKQITGTTIIGG